MGLFRFDEHSIVDGKKKKKRKMLRDRLPRYPKPSPLYEGIKMAGRFHIDRLNYKARGSGGWQ